MAMSGVFGLTGHSKARRACAWSHLEGKNDERTRFDAGHPHVKDAIFGLEKRAQLVKDANGKK